MTAAVWKSMFSRALAKSRDYSDWAEEKRDFKAVVEGVPCDMRCRMQILAPRKPGTGSMTGEVSVHALRVQGERVEVPPGWIHFSARDGAFDDPEPLLRLALQEVGSRVRADPWFMACLECDHLASSLGEPARRSAVPRL